MTRKPKRGGEGRGGNEVVKPTDIPQDNVAMLLAAGRYTVPEIAHATGLSATRIYALKESPLFLTLVHEYERRFAASKAESKLMDDTQIEKTVDTLLAFRDGAIADPPAAASVRLRATETLFSRQLPKAPVTGGAVGGPRVILNFNAETRQVMQQLLHDDGTVVDVEAEDPDDV